MPFINKLPGSTVPMRVYDLCRLVQAKRLTRNQLKNLLQPQLLDAQNIFGEVIRFCLNGQLIEETSDGTLQLLMEEHELASVASFRRAIAKRVFRNAEWVYARFTAWYVMRGEQVVTEKLGDLELAFNSEVNESRDLLYNRTNISAWKSWATFLGHGFYYGDLVIPNAAVRLQDVLETSPFETGKPYLFRDFMAFLQQACPELDGGAIAQAYKGKAVLEPQHLSMALSAGLRSLHDQGVIELRLMADAQDTWHLQRSQFHVIASEVSDITFKGVK